MDYYRLDTFLPLCPKWWQAFIKQQTLEQLLFTVTLCNKADHIYFHPVVFSIFLLSSSFFLA